MRSTPAGLPALDLTLRHDRTVEQQGQPRKVCFEVHAKAIGPVVQTLLVRELGSEAEFEGFLGAHRNGRGILFHVESVEFVPASIST